MKSAPLQFAPTWAESSAPRRMVRREVASLLLVNLPGEDGFVVATLDESNAIADPNSFLGRLLRPHCALMGLPYMSEN
jgi:hypothetical protein